MTILLCVMFFLSGAAALLFETLWFHQAGLALGNSIWASSLVLAGFMGGLALGNGLVGRWGHRIARPVRLYALLEAAIAVTGIALVHVLPQLVPFLSPALRPFADEPWILNPLRFGSAFVLLLAPSTAMGATLPLLVAALYRRSPHFGRVLGLLYGWNTLGAVCGALVGEAFLIGWLGVRGSALAAGAANLCALFMALALAPGLDAGGRARAGDPGGRLSGRALVLLAAAFAFGAALLALEVVWFRLLLLKVLGSTRAFSVMLATVLAGIALGGMLGSAWLGRAPGARRALGPVAFLSGVLCVVTYALHVPLVKTQPGVASDWWGVAILAVPLMFPVSLLSGVLFTLTGEALHREGLGETRAAGLLTLANTTGSMLGPLLGGFVLLPTIGIERSIEWLAVVYGCAGVLVVVGLGAPERRRERGVLAAAALAFVAAWVAFPRGNLEGPHLEHTLRRYLKGGSSELVAMREGLTETALYVRSDAFGEPVFYRLVTNSHSMSATTLIARRYMKLFVYLPVALHPEPRSALLISYGVGTTAKALTDTPWLERIDVVDVSRDILELSEVVYPDPAEHPLNDPRVTVHIEDGRYFLETTDQHFDLITGEPPPPKAAGIVNLYTREYFALMRDRLTEGGMATYWLPVHALTDRDALAITRAFCEAFPDCSLWSGSALDWVLLGTRDARGPVSEAQFRRQWDEPRIAGTLRDLGIETPELLGTLFMYGSDGLAELTRSTEPLVDDFPKRLGADVLPLAERMRVFGPWLDVPGARRRFARDPGVRALWPAELRERTLEWFWTRQVAHDFSLRIQRDEQRSLSRLDRLLRETPLETPVVWEVGSSADLQRAAAAARARGARGPELALHGAAGALAARDYAGAVPLLRAARAAGSKRTHAARLEAYALCSAGRPADARDRVAPLRRAADDPKARRRQGLFEGVLRGVDPACVADPGEGR